MPDGGIVDKIYLYDGTFEGLLTSIFESFIGTYRPMSILPEKGAQTVFGVEYIYVQTDEVKWKRVSKGIISSISRDSLDLVYNVFLSEHIEHGIMIYDYLKLAFRMGVNINNNLADDRVLSVINLSNKVSRERHYLTGFVRFTDIGGGILYSEIEPTYNIVELLMPYFCDRMPSQKFIIGDIKRKWYGVYNTQCVIFTDDIPAQFKAASIIGGDYERLWKDFFEAIAVEERKSRRRQMSHMPKKYWKHITEKKSSHYRKNELDH
jgi:probable DNA metabolism protein